MLFVFVSEKFSSFSEKVFFLWLRGEQLGSENFNFDARRREQLAKSKCQAMKMKLIRIFIFSPPRGALRCNCSSREWIMRLLEFIFRCFLLRCIIQQRLLCSGRWELTFSWRHWLNFNQSMSFGCAGKRMFHGSLILCHFSKRDSFAIDQKLISCSSPLEVILPPKSLWKVVSGSKACKSVG